MVKFAHMGDCHLGAWRQPELQQLSMECFSLAIDTCIKEKVDFVLIAGDLFDSAYPSIEVLKDTFSEFRKLKNAGINCYIIAGSHDYSVSGKTFLDVLEKADFCKNVFNCEEKDNILILNPILEKNIAIYGYPGKKSGLEIQDLKRIKLQDSPGFFKIFMLHTSIKDAIGTLPIDSIDINELPKADYYALGHLHIDYCQKNVVYSGPIFPNNYQELEELEAGSFYIVDVAEKVLKCRKIELKLKDTISLEFEIVDALTAKEKIISELEKINIENKILLLKLKGKLKRGKVSDIKFTEIEEFCKKKNIFLVLKSISQLSGEEAEIKIETENMEKLEEEIIRQYSKENESKFNPLIFPLINSLDAEKKEDEKTSIFENRLLSELQKILNFNL